MNTNRLSELAILVVTSAIYVLLATSVHSVRATPKSYDNLLREQGYTPLNHPRSNFGPGSIIPLDKNKNLFIAAQEECFPGLQEKLQTGVTKLLDRVDNTNLGLTASGKYSPGGTGLLAKLAAAFGFKRTSSLNVSFGETSAIDLTEVGLEKYLDGNKISKACAQHLSNTRNAVIFSMAQVSQMQYKFNGDKAVNASVDATLLKSDLQASGTFNYDHNNTDTLTVKQPMYVGYVAYSIKDLSITPNESSSDQPLLKSIHMKKLSLGNHLHLTD